MRVTSKKDDFGVVPGFKVLRVLDLHFASLIFGDIFPKDTSRGFVVF